MVPLHAEYVRGQGYTRSATEPLSKALQKHFTVLNYG